MAWTLHPLNEPLALGWVTESPRGVSPLSQVRAPDWFPGKQRETEGNPCSLALGRGLHPQPRPVSP